VSDSENSETGIASNRIMAIDALRGFDMFWLIGGPDGGRELVLAAIAMFRDPLPEAVLYHAEHVKWVGFSAWDLVMPLFLFVVGAAMPFSFLRRRELGQSKTELYVKIVRRFLILFVLGMIVQGHLLDFDLSTLHIFANTLQAIAVGYLVAGILLLNAGLAVQVAVGVLLLLGYWALMMFIPLAGRGAGVIEEHANAALAVDEFVLGRFRDGTTYTWVLSSMTFTATVMLGVFAGELLRSRLTPVMRTAALTGLGLMCLAAGWAWSEALGFPIIKHVWTSSMTLWAAGWSYLLLGLFYLLIDVIGWRRWAFPFVVIGMNAITIYVLNRFIPFRTIAENLVGGLAKHLGAAGPFTVWSVSVSLAWLLLYYLYRQRIFLRI